MANHEAAYGYVAGHPLTMTDPSGLAGQDITQVSNATLSHLSDAYQASVPMVWRDGQWFKSWAMFDDPFANELVRRDYSQRLDAYNRAQEQSSGGIFEVLGHVADLCGMAAIAPPAALEASVCAGDLGLVSGFGKMVTGDLRGGTATALLAVTAGPRIYLHAVGEARAAKVWRGLDAFGWLTSLTSTGSV